MFRCARFRSCLQEPTRSEIFICICLEIRKLVILTVCAWHAFIIPVANHSDTLRANTIEIHFKS